MSEKKQAEEKYKDDKPCWRVNGVWGNERPRCEKLQVVGHCRSCDVFEKAAREIIVGSTDSNAQPLSFEDLIQQQRVSGNRSILPFRLEGFCLGIPIEKIVTIHDHIPIHSIPFNRNPVVKGVVAINHEVFSFVDVVKLLSLPRGGRSTFDNGSRRTYKRVLVVDFNAKFMAFYVDEVYPVYRYFHQAVSEEPKDDGIAPFMLGRLIEDDEWCGDCYILDLESLLNEFESAFL